jgi:hypothetical protein
MQHWTTGKTWIALVTFEKRHSQSNFITKRIQAKVAQQENPSVTSDARIRQGTVWTSNAARTSRSCQLHRFLLRATLSGSSSIVARPLKELNIIFQPPDQPIAIVNSPCDCITSSTPCDSSRKNIWLGWAHFNQHRRIRLNVCANCLLVCGPDFLLFM